MSDERYEYSDLVRRDILKMIPPDGVVIGSIGCGFAATEATLVKEGREVHGIDVSERATEVARTRLTSARIVDPFEEHPFDRDSLDGLILADVIEHMPLAWERLKSFVEMVKPGGWVVISVPNMRNIQALATLAVRGEWPETPSGVFDRTHLQVMTRKRLIRWCEAANLKPEQWYITYHPSPKKRAVCRALHLGSLGLLRDFVTIQIQGRFRRV